MKFLAILQATVCGELEEDAGVESSDQGGDQDEDTCDQDGGGVGDYDVAAGFTAMFFFHICCHLMIMVIFDLLYNADAHFVCLSQSDHYVLSLVYVCLSLTFYPYFLEPSVCLFVCHILSTLS